MTKLRRYFITGMVVVVPFLMTLYVLFVVFRFADNLIGRYLNTYLKDLLGFYLPGLGVLVSVLFIIFIGFITTHFFGKRIFPKMEQWFSGLPLVKNIYPIFKQIVSFILAQKEFGFKKVVLVEYPSAGIWSFGFLTNEEFLRVDQLCGKDMVAVFIPSSPGPLTGYVIFVAKEKLKFPDIPITDALRIIISGGVFRPHS